MTTSKMKANVIRKTTQAKVEKIRLRQDLDAQIKKLTAERDAIDAEIQLEMEQNDAIALTFRNQTVVEFQWSNGSDRIDIPRLRKERPDVVKEFTKHYPGKRNLHYV